MKIGTFLRTVLLLLSCVTVFSFTASAGVELKHSYTFEDGTAADVIGGADGVVDGGAITDGSFVASANGDNIILPAEEIAINEYSSMTLEAYVTVGSNTVTNSVIFYLGGAPGGLGANGVSFAPKHWDGPNARATITCGSESAPWNNETVASTTTILDSEGEHHVVVTLDADSIGLFIDGVKIGKTVLPDGTSIANLSNDFAWIASGGYTGDATWLGTVHEYNIYEGVMDSASIAFRADSFDIVDLKHSYTFDLDASDVVGGADGTLEGDATVSGGMYKNTGNGYVTLPGEDIALNEYDAISLEAFVTGSNGLIAGSNTMLAYFDSGTAGANVLCIQPTKKSAGQVSVAAVGTWITESVGDLDDDAKHHIVASVTDTTIALFIDGVQTHAGTGTDLVANISSTRAWIGNSGWSDPNWKGSIEEFNIYNCALTPEFIAARVDHVFRAPSEDADLSFLAIDGGIMDVAFDPATTEYNVKVPEGDTLISVWFMTSSDLATVVGDDEINVASGSSADTIVVTAEDGSSKTYYVNVTVDATTSLSFDVPTSVSDYPSASGFTLPDYATMYWTGTADAVSQYPKVDSVIYAGTYNIALFAEMSDGSVEMKFLSLEVIDASYWIGGESTDFMTAANWGGTQALGNYSRFHIGPVLEGNNECIYASSGKFVVPTIKAGGKLYVEGNPMYADRMYMEVGGEVYVQGSGKLSVRNNITINGGTITVLDNAVFEQKTGKTFGFAVDTLTEATLNIFGGESWITQQIVLGKGTPHINFKDGGIAYFKDSLTVVSAIDSGYIMPVEDAVLAYDSAAWVSSVSFPIPEVRYEIFGTDSSFVMPDYVDFYAVGDSMNNITVVQTPAAGEVISGKIADGTSQNMTVTVTATDCAGNEVVKEMELNLQYGSVWRGGYSEVFEDSANWEGTWPLVAYQDLIFDKNFAEDNDAHYTGAPSGLRWGAAKLMAGNTLYLEGSVFYPNDPYEMYTGAEIVIDGGVQNLRESGASALNNGTITLLSHQDGYSWSEFDHKATLTLATEADDEFTFNLWGGEAYLGNIALGSGTVHFNFKDGGAAGFSDSTLVANAFASSIIEANENVVIRTEADYSKVSGATVIAPENQLGLVDGEGKFEVLDYTGLATFSVDGANDITITQSPAAGEVIDVLGTYDVIFTATDEWNNVSIDTCQLDVIDYTIFCPEVSTITDAYALDSVAVPDFTGDATTPGNWTGSVTVSQIPVAGTMMALDSIFDVTLTAMDEASHKAECSFTLTVIDTTIPVITVIEDQIVAMDEYCMATLPDYSTMLEVTDTCVNELTFTQSPVAGTQMSNIGDQTTVTITVADGNGNTSEAISFTATAQDITAPTVTKFLYPSKISQTVASGCEYEVRSFIGNTTEYVNATDYCAEEVTITQSPEAGTIITEAGDFNLTISFDDGNGNVVDSVIVFTIAMPNCTGEGVADQVIADALSVYPSPASTTVTIDASELGSDVVVTVLDLAGNVKAVLSNPTSIQVADYAAGIYVVKAVSSEGIAITKFVKE